MINDHGYAICNTYLLASCAKDGNCLLDLGHCWGMRIWTRSGYLCFCAVVSGAGCSLYIGHCELLCHQSEAVVSQDALSIDLHASECADNDRQSLYSIRLSMCAMCSVRTVHMCEYIRGCGASKEYGLFTDSLDSRSCHSKKNLWVNTSYIEHGYWRLYKVVGYL